jgi:hypothetical protein
MTQTIQLHSVPASDWNDAIYAAIAVFLTNQIALSMCDYKMNVVKVDIQKVSLQDTLFPQPPLPKNPLKLHPSVVSWEGVNDMYYMTLQFQSAIRPFQSANMGPYYTGARAVGLSCCF